MCDCFTYNLAKKKIRSYTIETVNPIDGNHFFDIIVRSPSETYYTEIFWSRILETNKAWDLYARLFYELQVQEIKEEYDILKKIQEFNGTYYVRLEHAFKRAYDEDKEITDLITPKPPEEKKNEEETKKVKVTTIINEDSSKEIEVVKKDIINKKLK